MTVDDDDDDIVCDGMAPDSHSDEGRESISRSASPSALITSAGNKSRSSISITGSGIRHQHHWQHQALHQSHEQHYHSYPGKEHQTRRIPAHQDGGSGGGDHDPGEDAASTAGVDMHDECNSRKIRRNRTVFTELQLMGLERRFDSQKYLSTPDRADLARVLGLTQLQVKTWYQVIAQFLCYHTFTFLCFCFFSAPIIEGDSTILFDPMHHFCSPLIQSCLSLGPHFSPILI